MRLAFFVSLVVVFATCTHLAASTLPVNIVLVTDNSANESSYVSLLQSMYGIDASINNVSNAFSGTLSAAQKLTLESADLIIVSRQTNSANYAAETTYWNSLQTPMILHNAYMARGGSTTPRWRWLNGNGTDISAVLQVDVHNPNDPIFDGVTITGGQVTIFLSNQAVSVTTATGAGNGDLLASQVGGIDAAYIARWDGTEPSYFTGSPQAPGGPRIWFAFPSTGSTANSGVFFTASTDDGKLMLENALTSLLQIPEPGTVGLFGLAGATLLLRRRQR